MKTDGFNKLREDVIEKLKVFIDVDIRNGSDFDGSYTKQFVFRVGSGVDKFNEGAFFEDKVFIDLIIAVLLDKLNE